MNGLYLAWAALIGIAVVAVITARTDRRPSETGEPHPGPVHYGHCNVDDHEDEDLETRHGREPS